MKIILLEDNVRLGDKGVVVDVKKGFAKNFLIPQKKAVIASEGNLSMNNNVLSQRKKKVEKEKLQHLQDAEKIKVLKLEFSAKAAVTGHIFGTVTTEDVVNQIKEKTGMEISKKKVALSTHIKTEGVYSAKIKLFTGVDVSIPIIVSVIKEDTKKENIRKSRKVVEKEVQASDPDAE